MEKEAHRALWGREESRESLDQLDPRERQAYQDPQDSRGSRVYRDPPGKQVLWDHKDHRVFQDKTACGDHQEREDFRASLVYPGHLDRWE